MTAPHHIGDTHPGHAKTRRGFIAPEHEAKRLARLREAMAQRRSYDHSEVMARWACGESIRSIARDLGVSHKTISRCVDRYKSDVARSPIAAHGNGLPVEPDDGAARNGHHRTNGAARSPQQPPPSHCPPPALANGVATNNSAVGEAGGLRGAPAGTFTPVKGQNEKEPIVEAGAPIVRRQHDDQGDLIYVVSLPAAHYTTHSRSLVDELLQPFEPRTIQWVNEMGDAA